MKKITVNTIIALALGSMCLSSCIGSFSLTNNVLNWNKRATDNKFINELIFIVISPAYAVCSAADLLVLNTIEFWTGDKVIANVGKTQKVTGKDGDIRELFSFNEDGSIQACLPNGQKMNVEQNEIGLYQLRMAVNDGLYFACNK